MIPVIMDVIIIGLGAAVFLDLAVGCASGLLQLAHADRSLAPALFWRCVLGEAALALGAIGWFYLVAAHMP